MLTSLPDSQSLNILQRLLLPEPGIAPDTEVYFHARGSVGFSMQQQSFEMQAGAELSFGSWFNLFNLGRWQRDSHIDSLLLRLTGQGRFEVSILQEQVSVGTQSIVIERFDLTSAQAALLDLSNLLETQAQAGLLHVSLRALSPDAQLSALDWCSKTPVVSPITMAAVIPSFHRETAVKSTIDQLRRLRQDLPKEGDLSVIVVDNGGGLSLPTEPWLKLLTCENFGGSGGFARGALAAKVLGASHCVFMDDDAVVQPEALRRMLSFLSYARNPDAAISGAMISQEKNWKIWENGAQFYKFCRPISMGVDLRKPVETFAMEHQSSAPKPPTFYGGWWCFAFPLAAMTYLPFPFFLRGDDVSFSLANRFYPITLNGVAAFQEGFTAKESPRSWYLDLRSHLLHHLSVPGLNISGLAAFKIPAFFLGQTLWRMHYGSAQAVLMALEDVLKGPQFFADNVNMTARLKVVDHGGALENWQSTDDLPYAATLQQKPKTPLRMWWFLTLNGYLLPGFRLYGRTVTIEAQDRRNLDLTLGAARVRVVNAQTKKCYHLRHDKLLALRLVLRFCHLGLIFLWRYQRLRRAYQQSYPVLTSAAFWRRRFGLPSDSATPHQELA